LLGNRILLVTGATGRIGRHLVNALLRNNEEVKVLIRKRMVEYEEVKISYGDLLDKDSLRGAVEDVVTIYHLAAVVDYLAPKDLMFKVNVLGTKNLLEVCRDKKFIYLSSTAVMGRKFKEIPANEKTPCKPSNYYGWTKYEAEKLVKRYNGIIIRSTNVFGPGFREGYEFILSQLEKGKLPIIGDGKNFIHWIHVNDLIQALLLAGERGKPGEIYIVAGKEVKTQKECLDLLCKYLGVEPPRKYVPVWLAKLSAYYSMMKAKMRGKRPTLIPEYVDKIASNRTFDISKARRELGFKPQVSYEEAAKEMVEEYKSLKEKKEDITEEKG
jgi:nucleoside-diphosphate-sugar epimerase